jgi:hypothetical protein
MRRLPSRTARTIRVHFFEVRDPAIIANDYDFSADGAEDLLNFLRSCR